MNNFEKIEIDDIYNGKIEEKLEENIMQAIDTYVDLYKIDLCNCLVGCESPIEQLMAISLFFVEKKFNSWNAPIEFLGIIPQEEIEIQNKKYRVDFLIDIAFKIIDNYGDILHLVIECDGYEFHQKTKEQVKKDYEKDRLLQMAGYNVLRFSGSEIYNDGIGCEQKINEFINNKYYKFLESKLKKNV